MIDVILGSSPSPLSSPLPTHNLSHPLVYTYTCFLFSSLRLLIQARRIPYLILFLLFFPSTYLSGGARQKTGALAQEHAGVVEEVVEQAGDGEDAACNGT